MSGSASPPETSLTTAAPAARAASATRARLVSMLTATPAAVSSRMTGRTRSTSVAASIRSAPGRVDSPPMSTRCAPASRRRTPCPTAASRSAYRPPSEKESGVTLRTPITTGPGARTRSVTTRRYRSRQRRSPARVGLPSPPLTCSLEQVYDRSFGQHRAGPSRLVAIRGGPYALELASIEMAKLGGRAEAGKTAQTSPPSVVSNEHRVKNAAPCGAHFPPGSSIAPPRHRRPRYGEVPVIAFELMETASPASPTRSPPWRRLHSRSRHRRGSTPTVSSPSSPARSRRSCSPSWASSSSVAPAGARSPRC